MHNAIQWFEIPVHDMDRAQRFYETVLARPMRREDVDGEALAVFAYDKPGVGGCLQAGANTPAMRCQGVRIYLDGGPSIDATLARIEGAGGRIAQPKSALPKDVGFIAHLLDIEGNEIGLHALT